MNCRIKKIDRLKEVFDYYFDKWDKKQINSKNLVCVNCFIEQTMSDLPPINKRKNAEKFYKSIFSLASDKDLLRKYPICTKSKHAILYDILQYKSYYKIDNYIVTQKELDEFMNSMKSVFKEELEIIPEFFDYIEKEFKSNISPKTK